MSAQIFEFRKYQKSRELARMQSDIEKSLAKLNQIAAQVFKCLNVDAAGNASGTDSSRT